MEQNMIDRYVIGGGNVCPYCQSVDIQSFGDFDMEDGVISISAACYTCNRRWNDVFKLIGVAEWENEGLPKPEPDPLWPYALRRKK